MGENTQKLADIANDKKELLNGFKVLGIFPFYLKHIRTSTQIEICRLRDKIQEIKSEGEVTLNDFYDTKIMTKTKPLIDKLITVALVNQRKFGWLLYPFVKAKVKECDHQQINSLYIMIVKLSDASFFLGYYHHMMTKDHMILKED